MIVEVLFIGLVVGFLYYEWTGISPGGVVAPGYFALYLRQPDRIAVTLLLAVVVWAVLELLSRQFVVYGRRRLLLALLIGFALKIAVDRASFDLAVPYLDVHSIGYVIPGLVANEMARQRPVPTLLSAVIVCVAVFFISLLLP